MSLRRPAPGRVEPLRWLIVVAALLATACTTHPPTRTEPIRSRGDLIAEVALAQVGQPYRYGGNARDGFDCSGLTRFVHAQQAIVLPRTAALQYSASKRLQLDELVAGDLVFFRMSSRNVDHVGIYVGQGRFVHAPRAGSNVTIGILAEPWFSRHFVGGGRYWDSAVAR